MACVHLFEPILVPAGSSPVQGMKDAGDIVLFSCASASELRLEEAGKAGNASAFRSLNASSN